MATLRLIWRLARLLATTIACVIPHLFVRDRRRSPWPRRFLDASARAVGVDVHITGTPRLHDVFYVANHLSWIDIFAMGGATGCAFISKDGVGSAPIVGTNNDLHESVADPLAQAMILTAIVITMGVAAFVLALTYRSYTIRARDEVENDPEDTMVSQRRTPADAPYRDRSDDPLTGEPSKSGDAFDAQGNPIPLEALTNIEDLEAYEDLHDGDFDDPTDSAYADQSAYAGESTHGGASAHGEGSGDADPGKGVRR